MSFYNLYYSCRPDNHLEAYLGEGTIFKEIVFNEYFIWFKSDVCYF
jgi:hypothetical protein